MQTPVFYRPEMSAQLSVDSISKSSSKPERMISRWKKRHADLNIQSFEPVDRDAIKSAHDASYVDGILDLEFRNGFGTKDKSIADSLPYTVGSMVAATEHVLDNGGFACSPTSGFHHAHYDQGHGFCTFNGLIVAAQYALARGATVGILDGDAHYGDGTQNIIDRLGLEIKHRTIGARFHSGRANVQAYLEWWYEAIEHMLDCDVVLYQAGADPCIDDPLGGHVKREVLAIRDHHVFSAFQNVAWNLAGGYGPSVLKIHDATMDACIRAERYHAEEAAA